MIHVALVLGRKTGESVIINGNIKVTVIKTEDGLLKLSIDAPPEVNIVREEVLIQAVQTELSKTNYMEVEENEN